MDIAQLQQLMALRTQPDDTQPLIDALSQDIAASGMEKLAAALTELKSLDIDPSMYIPVSRQYTRSQRDQSRIRQDEARAAQELRHKQELHDIEVAALKASHARMSAPLSIPTLVP